MVNWIFDRNKLDEPPSEQNEFLAHREILQNALDASPRASNEDLDNVEFKILRLNQTSIFCYN
jgi:hypothetical protein